MPVAAETKFWTPSAADWTKWLIVLSPPYACQFVLVPKLTAVLNATRGSTAGKSFGLPGRCALQPLQHVHDEDAEHVEHHHGDRVLLP